MTAPQLDSVVGDAADGGGDSAHAHATRLASIIAAGMDGRNASPTLAPGGAAEVVADPAAEAAAQAAADIAAAAPTKTPEQIAAETAAAVTAAASATTEEDFTDEQFSEAEKTLVELGVDLGVDRSTVPPELMPAYGKLVQSAIDLSQAELTERLSAHEANRQLQEFGERMEKEPEKVLLAIAITKPDVMEKVVQIFQQMQGDESYRDLIVREMQTDARDRDISRRENTLQKQDMMVKARQVTAATRVACRQQGVPFEMGEKVVALAIKANQGKLEASEVAGIITGLKGFVTTQAARPKPLVAAPTKVATQGTAPGAPVAGTLAPQTTTEPAPVRQGGGGVFRNLIR